METGSFIQDLAVILTVVGLVSGICTRFGWPKVIGYIFAGVLLGKHTFGGSWFINESSINVLGELGVVFLMLTLGLEFSLRKLKKVGNVAFPTAVFDMAVMIWLGHFVGTRFLGWSSVQGLFLGAAISDSATTLLAKTINEMGWGARRFTKYVFGITITEDILCIGVIAFLTGIVKTNTFQVGDVLYGVGGLLLFLVGVTVFGLMLVPRLLNYVSRLKDDETLLLILLGFCFLVSFVALKLNYSLALGAFMVGVVGAEAEPLRRMYQLCVPLRTMFSAIFFVTIGLLVEPAALLFHWKATLGITALVVICKSINCTIGNLATGQDLKNSIQAGIALGQIGEFAYLVALIGLTMGAVDSSFYQIAVGVSIISTLLNPVLIRLSDPFSVWVVEHLPHQWSEFLITYSNWYERFRHASTASREVKSLRMNFILVALLLTVVAFTYIAAGMLAGADFSRFSPFVEQNKRAVLWSVASVLTLPNAIFLFFRARALGYAVAEVTIPARVGDTQWALSFRRMSGLLFALSFISLLFFEMVLLSGSIMPEQTWARIVIFLILLAIGIGGWSRFKRLGAASFSTLRKVVSEEVEVFPTESTAELLDIHTEKVRVGFAASVCGRSLRDVDLRARAGVSVLCIERNGKAMLNPDANDVIESGDTLLLLGDDLQITRARSLLV